jgi:hypothetical protein
VGFLASGSISSAMAYGQTILPNRKGPQRFPFYLSPDLRLHRLPATFRSPMLSSSQQRSLG